MVQEDWILNLEDNEWTKTTIDHDRILFFSVPYAEGWTAYVDGYKTDILPCLEDTFISIDLSNYENGKHNVELKFY